MKKKKHSCKFFFTLKVDSHIFSLVSLMIHKECRSKIIFSHQDNSVLTYRKLLLFVFSYLRFFTKFYPSRMPYPSSYQQALVRFQPLNNSGWPDLAPQSFNFTSGLQKGDMGQLHDSQPIRGRQKKLIHFKRERWKTKTFTWNFLDF